MSWFRVTIAMALGTTLGILLGVPNCSKDAAMLRLTAPGTFNSTSTTSTTRPLATTHPGVPAGVAVARSDWPPQHRSNGSIPRQPFISADLFNPCIPRMHHLAPRGDYEYHSSEMEREWYAVPHRRKICKTANKQKHLAEVWMNYTSAVFKTNQTANREPTEEEARVLSYFSYPRADGTRVKRYIEPLHGVARHPLWLCVNNSVPGKPNFELTYLLPENACAGTGTPIRGVFFDLGSGRKAPRFETDSYAKGTGLGPSIPLFYKMYLDRCIEFQDIYAWEAQDIEHEQFWKQVPDYIRARLRLFNTPVVENLCPASPEGNFPERGSFLRMLKTAVTVDDYVVMKVDIDSLGTLEGIELAIVESIAHLPELSELVDELYFEYHFYFHGHNFGWGTGDFGGRDVDTAINLMLRLREAGIRSHFWI